MRPSRFVLIAGLLALAAVEGCDTGLPPEVARLGFVERELKFALDVPAGWTYRESRGTVAVVLTAPGAEDAAHPNVVVVVTPAGGLLTADDLAAAGRDSLQTLKGFREISDEPRKLADGRDARVLTFDHAALGSPVRQRQLYAVAGGRAYTVTATAPSPEAFEAHQADFETVLGSFRAAW